MGTFRDKEGNLIPKINAARNAESYVYFAMSYWYVDQDWSGREPVTFYTGMPDLAEWLGESDSEG